MARLDTWAPRALALLRIIAALLFIQYGLIKFFGFPTARPGPSGPLPTMLAIAAAIELITGTLIALGLYTRVAAFLGSGTMAAAYFLAHAPQSFWPAANQGGMAILFCFIFLYLACAGPGAWSLDAVRRGRRA